MKNKCNTNSKKILIFGPLPPAVGGVATNIQLLLNSDLKKRYIFLTFDPSKQTPKGRNLVLKIKYKFRSLLKYHQLLKKDRPDLIHIFASTGGNFWISSVFLFYAKMLGRRTILREGGPFDKFYREKGIIKQWLIRIFLNLSDKLIVLSPCWKDFFKKIVSEDKIEVVSNGVPISDYHREFSLDTSLNSLKNKRIILFLGSLGKRKGFYDIVKAIPFVLDHREDTAFVFAGEAETLYEMADVKKTINMCGKWRKMGGVYFLGNVCGKKKLSLLSASYIFILPTHAEGFPNSLLEAMASGLPVVTTNIRSIPEIVIDGENGFIIKPGECKILADKINLLLDNPELCRKMGTNNVNKIRKEYDYRFVVEKLSNVYEAVIN